jgi:hypothetical protein
MKPIIFNAEMVRAILEGRKTQTRRPVKPQPYRSDSFSAGDGSLYWKGEAWLPQNLFAHLEEHCPFGQVGERLWVMETWFAPDDYIEMESIQGVKYRSDCSSYLYKGEHWKPSSHMPRWASRLTLEITNVRVERAREISMLDAIAEGAKGHDFGAFENWKYYYETIWDSLYSKTFPWESNPFVWAIDFKVVK